MNKKELKKLFSFIIAVVIIICLIINCQNPSYSGKNETNNIDVSTDLQVYFFDVGQADSILVINENHYMLIDAGNNEDGEKLVTYLKNLGINDFDYIVGTHPHEDHIGGLDNIINSFTIENILLPDAYTTTKSFEDVLNAIEKNNLRITIPEIDTSFKLGEANVEVMYTGTDTSDLNNTSIVLKITFGNKKFLFTGDATKETEDKIINKDIDVDVLKVGHHGSRYSTSEKFLEKVTPEYAIISAGKNNSYGHPHKETLNRLTKYTKNIYRTDDLGTIKITSDGNNINITNFKTDTNG